MEVAYSASISLRRRAALHDLRALLDCTAAMMTIDAYDWSVRLQSIMSPACVLQGLLLPRPDNVGAARRRSAPVVTRRR